MTSQYQPNIPLPPWPPVYHPGSVPGMQTHPSSGSLPQNVLDQIRSCVGNTTPIFILPGGSCHQPTSHQQSQSNQGQQTGQSTVYCPPSFYPYPIPMPVFDSFGAQNRVKDGPGCSCCRRSQDFDGRVHLCCCNLQEREEHRCTVTSDDTICSRKNCPAAISLQALASQLLSLPGIISCAATRLILRKIPGSNITCTMEDTMDKALKSIDTLTKNQLLAESRNAQQVNALINLHMTTNLPSNIIPLLTLLQLKVNVLKAQVENLINKKVMECQASYGCEVETSGPIDPTILTMKTNAELRDLLSVLRQKECDERVNVNFSPYHSQKVIAEARLNNVQAKIQQIEGEFDRRRGCAVPTPTLTSRVIQQFSESRCTYGFTQAPLFEPYVQRSMESPDPFTPSIRNPRRLYLKPRDQKEGYKATSEIGTSSCKDTGTGECTVDCMDKAVEPKTSVDTCSCEESSSDDSFDGAKKKLRLKIDRKGLVTLTSVNCRLKDVPLLMLAPNVTRIEEDPKEVEEIKEMREHVERMLSEPILETETKVLEEDDDENDVELLPIRRKADSKQFGIITISDDEEIEKEVEKEPKKEIEIIVISDDEDEGEVDIRKEGMEEKPRKEILVITISDDEEEDIDQEKVEIKKEPEINEIILEHEDIEVKRKIKEEKEIPDHTIVKEEPKEEFATGISVKEELKEAIKEEPIEEKMKRTPPWKVTNALKTWQLKKKLKLTDKDIKTSVDILEEPKMETVEVPRVETVSVKEEPEEAIKAESIQEKVKPIPAWKVAHAAKTWQLRTKPKLPDKDIKSVDVSEELKTEREVETVPIKEEPEESKKPKFVTEAVIQLKPTVKKAELYIPPRVEATPVGEESPVFVTREEMETVPIKEPEETKESKFITSATIQLKPTVKKAELYIPSRVEATPVREKSPIFVTRAYIEPEVPKMQLRAQPEMEIKVESKIAKQKKTGQVIIPRFETTAVREEDTKSEPRKESYVRPKWKVAEAVKTWEKRKEVHPTAKSMKPRIEPETILTRKQLEAAVKEIGEPKTEETQPHIISKKELVKAIKDLDLNEKVLVDTAKETKIGIFPEKEEPRVSVEEIGKPERYVVSKKKLMEAITAIETNKTGEIDLKDRLDLSGIRGLYKQVVTTLGDKPAVKDIPITLQPRVVGPSGITWTPDPLLSTIKLPRNPIDKKETNLKSDGELQKKKEDGNVQIVSLMNHIEYTQRFGDFRETSLNELHDCILEDGHQRSFNSSDVERANIANDMNFFSKRVNTSMIFVNQQYGPLMISVATETSVEKIALSEKMFPKLHRRESKYEKVNGSNPFPPLKELNTMGTETAKTISENVFHQRGIESGWKTVCDRGSSCWDSEVEDSIVSTIYSAIENKIASFTSLLSNVPSLRLNKMSSNCNGSSLPSQRDSIKNKRIRNTKDDWVYLPSRNRVSVSKIRELKPSIIVDKETNKYSLVGQSVSSRELGFKRPYQRRRFLVIRSKLKNPANSKHEQPFTLFKTSKRTKVPQATKRERSKKFLLLPKIPEEVETLSNNSGEFVKIENESLSETSSSEFVKISETEISQLINE
ncbi:titin-like [Ceratina calcarata]|uniref:Titin-like n=1 Tax=Ceratina calcarata TaxID=156304 RepID=A0AAJ7S5H9_9HYME|nr:titin-like [Ceratina calcarata]